MSNILVVDDKAGARDVLNKQLGKAGHIVTEAEDEDAAAEHLKTKSFDLVLTDVRMKARDGGLEVLRVVKEEHPECRIAEAGKGHRTKSAQQEVKGRNQKREQKAVS